VGEVQATLHADASVSLENVPSQRVDADVAIEVAGVGPVRGDVAWGGNWFFLVKEPVVDLGLDRVDELTDLSWRIRQAVNQQGYPDVDHVELFGPPLAPEHHSRNFVLCPGKAYDRSPCGTGTSAKLACLAAEGKLAENETWIQESILGSTFRGRYRWQDRASGWILPTITGTAHVTAEATLLLDERDPMRWGVRPSTQGAG
jgi:4-hydroxyproline epimerase